MLVFHAKQAYEAYRDTGLIYLVDQPSIDQHIGQVADRTSAADAARAIVVCPIVSQQDRQSQQNKLQEAVSLTEAIGVTIVGQQSHIIKKIHPAHYVGAGVLDGIAEQLATAEEQGVPIQLVVMDCQLSPIQQRNLEQRLQCKVIDRTALILEIFGERARTHEGKLQVDLAYLSFQRSRLVRSWTHLERQRGGGGFMGGPGERQLELDRRLIDDKIIRLKKQLADVQRTRSLHRAGRQAPVIALVGYTNAGKSTLFNRLSDSAVLAKDMLFATLDPTMRTITLPAQLLADENADVMDTAPVIAEPQHLPANAAGRDKPGNGLSVVLSDTVGFVADLPTTLVAAFRATLEEVMAADIILHVRDISHPETEQQKQDVLHTLSEIGLDDAALDGKYLEVWNKADLLDGDSPLHGLAAKQNILLVSALDGQGVQQLEAACLQLLTNDWQREKRVIPYANGAQLAALYRQGMVLSRQDQEHGVYVDVLLPKAAAVPVDTYGDTY